MTKPQSTSDIFMLQRIDFQHRMIKSQHWMTCLNCMYFKETEDLCELFKAKPPTHVIVTGCKDHLDDIPF